MYPNHVDKTSLLTKVDYNKDKQTKSIGSGVCYNVNKNMNYFKVKINDYYRYGAHKFCMIIVGRNYRELTQHLIDFIQSFMLE